MTLTYLPSTVEDAEGLTLRAEDAAEVALWGEQPGPALVRSIRNSLGAHTVRDSEGQVVAIFGFSETEDALHPWLLSSPLVHRHGREALRVGRDLLDEMRWSDKLICNWVGKDARRNRAFVKALGFRIVPTPGSPFDFFFLPNHVS